MRPTLFDLVRPLSNAVGSVVVAGSKMVRPTR